MKKLSESRKELARLIIENPELPIKAKVDADIIFDDCYAWFMADIHNPRVEEYYEYGERLYTEEENILEDIENDIADEIIAACGTADELTPEGKKMIDTVWERDVKTIKCIMVDVVN